MATAEPRAPATYRDKAPGVYREDVFPAPPFVLTTGVPVFLGYATNGPFASPQRLTLDSQFESEFVADPTNPDDGYLAHAVRGFFANEGSVCYVVRLDPSEMPLEALRRGLAALEPLDAVDLVCAPAIMRWAREDVRALQAAVVEHCDRSGNRFAILDAIPMSSPEEVLWQLEALPPAGSNGANAALYYPSLVVPRVRGGRVVVPPCGHVAGVFSRTDRRVGVHKAPANEELRGVLDLDWNVTNEVQARLQSVNCLRAFPGRGLRIWGARTLSADPAWMHVSVRRLFLTVRRWLEHEMGDVAFEPHGVLLWARIERELRAYLGALFQQGALRGATEDEAFYVKCDAETNPPDVRDTGVVVTEIGLAPSIPHEFVVVRLVHGPSGVTITEPA